MKKGYVYKLTDGIKFYIGSTSLTPEARFEAHKDCSSKASSQKQPVYRYFKSIEWKDVIVETLRECEYNVKRDLLQYEREEYDKVAEDSNCLNVNRPSITKEERKQMVKEITSKCQEENRERYIENTTKWQEENKERCKENLKKWRDNNPEKVKAQRERHKAKGYPPRERNKEDEYRRLCEWRAVNPEKYAEQRKRSIQQINEKRRLAREAKNNVENNTN